MPTLFGYFKPNEWSGQEGFKHIPIILVVTKLYETPGKEEVPKRRKRFQRRRPSEPSSFSNTDSFFLLLLLRISQPDECYAAEHQQEANDLQE